MAPAGSWESLAAALRSGADAVYFGVGSLNMRSNATANFQPEDLPKVVRLCHAKNCQAYLTLNIVVFDPELEAVKQVCAAAKSAGVDAVIASDFAVVTAARQIGLPVHMSVQANICNLAAVRFYAQFADLVVLARELPLSAIKQIINGIKAENITGPSGKLLKTELFIHGALCVSFSGKCYMSLAEFNASANRGACYQNCRRQYRITDLANGNELDIANGYVMSPADLCMIRFMPELLESGVDVLKIEGRGRSADYVAKVTQVYRQAVDAYNSDTFTPEQAELWRTELQQVFNRNFWDGGYYLGENLGVWSNSGNNQSPIQKIHAGQVTGYFSKLGVAEVRADAAELKVGDKILFIGPTTGAVEYVIPSLRLSGQEVTLAPKGATVSFPVPVKVRTSDRVYLLCKRKFGSEDSE